MHKIDTVHIYIFAAPNHVDIAYEKWKIWFETLCQPLKLQNGHWHSVTRGGGVDIDLEMEGKFANESEWEIAIRVLALAAKTWKEKDTRRS